MEKPFCHLNIPYRVKESWETLPIDLHSKQYISITPHEVFEEETLQFLHDRGLEIAYKPNIWSWLKWKPDVWHTDQRDSSEQIVAINYLLRGSPGSTEWIDKSKTTLLALDEDPVYKTRDIRYMSPFPPDFKEGIKPGYPMMIDTSVPHRVSRLDQKDTNDVRWTIRIFLKKLNSDVVLTWKEALRILGPYEYGGVA